MRRVIAWIVGIAAIIGAVSVCVSFNADMGRVREIQEQRRATPTPTPSWEERCFSAWDGSVRSMIDRVKADPRVTAPETFEHQETRYTSARGSDGRYGVRMQFTVKNVFGVPFRYTATGWVDPATCDAIGVVITG